MVNDQDPDIMIINMWLMYVNVIYNHIRCNSMNNDTIINGGECKQSYLF